MNNSGQQRTTTPSTLVGDRASTVASNLAELHAQLSRPALNFSGGPLQPFRFPNPQFSASHGFMVQTPQRMLAGAPTAMGVLNSLNPAQHAMELILLQQSGLASLQTQQLSMSQQAGLGSQLVYLPQSVTTSASNATPSPRLASPDTCKLPRNNEKYPSRQRKVNRWDSPKTSVTEDLNRVPETIQPPGPSAAAASSRNETFDSQNQGQSTCADNSTRPRQQNTRQVGYGYGQRNSFSYNRSKCSRVGVGVNRNTLYGRNRSFGHNSFSSAGNGFRQTRFRHSLRKHDNNRDQLRESDDRNTLSRRSPELRSTTESDKPRAYATTSTSGFVGAGSRSSSKSKFVSRTSKRTTNDERRSLKRQHSSNAGEMSGDDDQVSQRSNDDNSDEEEFAEDDFSVASSDFDEVASASNSEDNNSEDKELHACSRLRISAEAASYWTECAHAKLYYRRAKENANMISSTEKLVQLQATFENRMLTQRRRSRANRPECGPLPLAELLQRFACHTCCHDHEEEEDTSCSDSESSDSDSLSDLNSKGTGPKGRWQFTQDEIARKVNHPDRLHPDLWFNEKDQTNDGPLCRCSWKSRKTGIRHCCYPGETHIPDCDPNSNNFGKLYHYRVVISPTDNFKVKPATTIRHDGQNFVFDGFSLFCHRSIPDKLPACHVIRYNIEYTIQYIEEEPPENFTVRDLHLLWEYLFVDLLELYDLTLSPEGVGGCPIFHILPRFVRDVDEGGKQLLSTSQILAYLLRCGQTLVSGNHVPVSSLDDRQWQKQIEQLKGQLVTNPSKRPSTIRIDQLDRVFPNGENLEHPLIVHFGLKPAMLTYAGNVEYQKAWKQYVKYRHLLANKPKVLSEDRTKLAQKESYLQRLRAKASLKRDVTVEVSSKDFYCTGLYADVVQHALMLPVLFCHLRFHWSLDLLERERLRFVFKSRSLLELALTHPSYRTNYGMNPDHARNTLSNCGMRQPTYGDARIHHIYTRKRGINTLIDIMARMGSKKVKQSRIMNNERLEYLGDAVIEFLSTVHLFFMFPDLQEGGLATYRSALVQNRQLASLAKRLGLDEFMLYAHGPDLCHDSDLRHAMANCFEAVMAALFLDGGLDEADRVFAHCLFPDTEQPTLLHIWQGLSKDPLQEQEPNGDRHWIPNVEILQNLTHFEEDTGIRFNHIRILARAFTRRNVGYNFLTLGHNQRMEFLGDTVLQLVTSVYLYKHFPDHHEGHLSLLRSCLVNNKTQSVICDDLGLTQYVVSPPALSRVPAAVELRVKDKADLLESLIGAIFIDRGLDYCRTFCKVCFFPRLKYFIMTQKWNDAKSQLQQCCLTLRSPNGGEPDIPYYKIIEARGPTNTRVYTVAVYFRNKRLAKGTGHSVQQAEMSAAEKALRECKNLFPHLEKQRSIIEKRFKSLPEKFYIRRRRHKQRL